MAGLKGKWSTLNVGRMTWCSWHSLLDAQAIMVQGTTRRAVVVPITQSGVVEEVLRPYVRGIESTFDALIVQLLIAIEQIPQFVGEEFHMPFTKHVLHGPVFILKLELAGHKAIGYAGNLTMLCQQMLVA
jgi:hypothetical protein